MKKMQLLLRLLYLGFVAFILHISVCILLFPHFKFILLAGLRDLPPFLYYVLLLLCAFIISRRFDYSSMPPKKTKSTSKPKEKAAKASKFTKVKTSYPSKTKRKRADSEETKSIPGNQLEAYGDQPAPDDWNVRLADPLWDIVNIRNVKFEKADAYTIRYNFPATYRFLLHAYSPEGLKEGTNGSAIYLRVNRSLEPYVPVDKVIEPTGDEKETKTIKDRKFEVKAENLLPVVLANVDKYSQYAVTALNPLLEKEFEQRFGSHNTRLLSGLTQYEKDCDTVVRGEEYCLFPHRKYSNFQTGDKEDDPILDETSASKLTDCTGNSNFMLTLKIKAMEVRYTRGTKADNGTMTIQPYVNVETVTWLNEGQDVEAVEVDKEVRKAEEQARRDKKLLSALGL